MLGVKTSCLGDPTVMGLIHNSEDNLGVTFVLGSKLAPDVGELSIGWTSLAYNPSVPTGIWLR